MFLILVANMDGEKVVDYTFGQIKDFVNGEAVYEEVEIQEDLMR
jgi:hypothetical protein